MEPPKRRRLTRKSPLQSKELKWATLYSYEKSACERGCFPRPCMMNNNSACLRTEALDCFRQFGWDEGWAELDRRVLKRWIPLNARLNWRDYAWQVVFPEEQRQAEEVSFLMIAKHFIPFFRQSKHTPCTPKAARHHQRAITQTPNVWRRKRAAARLRTKPKAQYCASSAT